MHYFRREFLEEVAMRLHTEGHFHVARKTIPSVDGPVKVEACSLRLLASGTTRETGKQCAARAAADANCSPF